MEAIKKEDFSFEDRNSIFDIERIISHQYTIKEMRGCKKTEVIRENRVTLLYYYSLKVNMGR